MRRTVSWPPPSLSEQLASDKPVAELAGDDMRLRRGVGWLLVSFPDPLKLEVIWRI